MQSHSASERSVWYGFLMLGIVPGHHLRTPFQTVFKIVEPDGGEAGSHEEGLEVPVDDVLGLDGTASEGGEHEAVLLPRGAGH